MSRPEPAQDLYDLDWSDEWPDQTGYWWFSHDEGHTGFTAHMGESDLIEMDEEGVFYLHDLHLSRMTRERWENDGWLCCPVVLA